MTLAVYEGGREVIRAHAFAPELAAALMCVPLEQPEAPPSAAEIAEHEARLHAWLRALAADDELTK
jgi:hypothetical protein